MQFSFTGKNFKDEKSAFYNLIMEIKGSSSVEQEGVDPVSKLGSNNRAKVTGVAGLLALAGVLGMALAKKGKNSEKLPEEKEEIENLERTIKEKESRIDDRFKELELKREVLKDLIWVSQEDSVYEKYKQDREIREKHIRSLIEKSKIALDKYKERMMKKIARKNREEVHNIEIEVLKREIEVNDSNYITVENEIVLVNNAILDILSEPKNYGFGNIEFLEELRDNLKREIASYKLVDVRDTLKAGFDTLINQIKRREKTREVISA